MTRGQKLAYALPHLALNFSGMFMGQRLLSFYDPSQSDVDKGASPLVTAGVLSALLVFGGLVDALADPPIGYLSDRSRSRFGRRMPFILLGTPVMALSFVAHWFPPDAGPTVLNALFIALVLFAYKVSFTAVLGPYEALLPEIARDDRTRISLSVYVSVAFVVGTALGAAAGPLEDAFGIPGLAWLAGLSLLLFLVPPAVLRETPHSAAKEPSLDLWRSVASVYRNRAFLAVVGMATFAQMALVMLVADLDYFTKEVLDGDPETWRTWMLATLLVGAMLFMPLVQVLSKRFTKKGLMLFGGAIIALGMAALPGAAFVESRGAVALAVMAVLAFPTAVTFVLARVFIAEIADYDESLTGKRREGILNGAMALVTKLGLGIGMALVGILKGLGDSREDPTGILLVGPVAAALMVLAVLFFARFPEREVLDAIARYRTQTANR